MPLVAVTVMMNVPRAGLLPRVRVSVDAPAPPTREDGVSAAVTPRGRPETVRVTGCAKPLRGAMVTVVLEIWRGLKLSVEGEEVTVKSVTWSLTVNVCTVGPLEPVMVRS
jgi:hypothetical protein